MKSLNNFLIDNNGLNIRGGSDIGFGPLVRAGKSENTETNKLALLRVILPNAVALFIVAKSRFDSSRPAGGASCILRAADPCEDF